MRLFLGISKVIWIPRGVIYDVDTDGHVDNLCCFSRPGEVILTYPSDSSHPQWERSEEARKILESSTDAKGRKLKIHLLEHPKPLTIKVINNSRLYNVYLLTIILYLFIYFRKKKLLMD